MKAELVGLCVAKNEADVVESMIRHNLCFLDRLRVVDNESADTTVLVLRQLQAEFGDRLDVVHDLRHGHQQTQIINETLGDSSFTAHAEQIVLLDADEFIKGDRDVFRTTLLESRVPIRLPWITYIPVGGDDRSVANPIARIRHRKARERPQFFKVTVPKELLGLSWVTPGSHSIRSKVSGFEPRQVPGLSIAHFPVRTCEQLISKVLIGSWNLRLRRSKSKGEAQQWRDLADRIVSGWIPTEAELENVALNYISRKPGSTLLDPLTSPTPFALRYTESDRDNLLRKLIAFTESTMCILETSSQEQEPVSVAQEGS